MATEYDIIVVGAGLIGSAAARHLVEISKNVKVLLIGPEEPKVGGVFTFQWQIQMGAWDAPKAPIFFVFMQFSRKMAKILD